jgi:hypothetical protein
MKFQENIKLRPNFYLQFIFLSCTNTKIVMLLVKKNRIPKIIIFFLPCLIYLFVSSFYLLILRVRLFQEF